MACPKAPPISRLPAAALLAGLLATAQPAAARGPLIGEKAPDFEVTTVDGQKLTLADFQGQVLVITIWATWCVPCKQELPLLDAYYRVQQPHGLRVIALTTENSLSPAKLKPLAAVLSVPLAWQFKGRYGPMLAAPGNFVIDRDGVLRYAQAGAMTLQDLNSVLVPLLQAGSDADFAPETAEARSQAQ